VLLVWIALLAVAAAGRPERIRVVVGARSAPLRAGIRAALTRAGIVVAAEGADAASTVAAVEAERPDVCILDRELPGGALGAAAAVATPAPAPRVLVVGGRGSEPELRAVLLAGANGYLPGEIDRGRLAAAVVAMAHGEAVLPSPAVAQIVAALREYRHGLSERQAEVLVLLGEGLTTKEVALRLGLSPTTVRRHVATAVRRLGAPDRAAAVELLRPFTRGERK
jgi:DNA-binding NarL/FixJ family response regulator